MNKQEFEREFRAWEQSGLMPVAHHAARRIDDILSKIGDLSPNDAGTRRIDEMRAMIAGLASTAMEPIDRPSAQAVYKELKAADEVLQGITGAISERREQYMRVMANLSYEYTVALAESLMQSHMDLCRALVIAGGGKADPERTDPDTPILHEVVGALTVYLEDPEAMQWPR